MHDLFKLNEPVVLRIFLEKATRGRTLCNLKVFLGFSALYFTSLGLLRKENMCTPLNRVSIWVVHPVFRHSFNYFATIQRALPKRWFLCILKLY